MRPEGSLSGPAGGHAGPSNGGSPRAGGRGTCRRASPRPATSGGAASLPQEKHLQGPAHLKAHLQIRLARLQPSQHPRPQLQGEPRILHAEFLLYKGLQFVLNVILIVQISLTLVKIQEECLKKKK